MQLKTIYTNLKPKYKLIIWVGIVLTIYILYGLNYPKRYFFSCVGTQNVNIFKITKDQTETKDVLTDSKGFITEEDISVEKYFFGLFHTLNKMKISQCKQDSDSEIVCNKGNDYQISFNAYTDSMNESFTFVNKEKNEKKFYFTTNIKCQKNKSSLN